MVLTMFQTAVLGSPNVRKPAKQSLYKKIKDDDPGDAADGKAIILHGFSPAQVHALVVHYRDQAHLPQDVAFAMVTDQSAGRRLGEVVAELQEDAKATREQRESKKGLDKG